MQTAYLGVAGAGHRVGVLHSSSRVHIHGLSLDCYNDLGDGLGDLSGSLGEHGSLSSGLCDGLDGLDGARSSSGECRGRAQGIQSCNNGCREGGGKLGSEVCFRFRYWCI